MDGLELTAVQDCNDCDGRDGRDGPSSLALRCEEESLINTLCSRFSAVVLVVVVVVVGGETVTPHFQSWHAAEMAWGWSFSSCWLEATEMLLPPSAAHHQVLTRPKTVPKGNLPNIER